MIALQNPLTLVMGSISETFKCENDLCEEIHERTISRDPNSDEQEVPILRTKKRRYL